MKKKQKQKETENLFAETLIEMPVTFSIGEEGKKKFFNVWPKSIGKRILLDRLKAQLDFNDENARTDALLEAMRVCKDKSNIVMRMIAVSTARTKKLVYDEARTQACIRQFREGLTLENMATLLLHIMQDDDIAIEKIKKYYGIDKEQRKREAIAKVRKKEPTGTVNIGGCSLYGGLVAFCCEKFGMTIDEALWDVSYASLMLMYADYPDSVYLSEKEYKSLPAWARQGRDTVTVDGDNREELIKAIKSQSWK